KPFYSVFLIGALFATSCHSINGHASPGENDVTNQHSTYDDSTLRQTQLPVLMPYNRIIQPAGSVVQYGDGAQENHSLDARIIPGTDLLAVEDRYGIAVVDTKKGEVTARWTYSSDRKFRGVMSSYSGIRVFISNGQTQIFWSAANTTGDSYVMQAIWESGKLSIKNAIPFKPEGNSPLALPNGIAINTENGTDYLYVVLNGNNQLVKVDLKTQMVKWSKSTGVAPYGIAIVNGKAFVTNWGGPAPVDTTHETAGVPYGKAYIDPKTGAINRGSVSVFDLQSGETVTAIETGLHPNDIIASADNKYVYVANGNSDNISVIDAYRNKITSVIPVSLFNEGKVLVGDSPNALHLSDDGRLLYVANGLDNAVAVIQLGAGAAAQGSGKSVIKGFIPTEAYPAGLEISGNTLFVTNLEGEGARVNSSSLKKVGDVPETKGGAYNSHHQTATVSIIQLPDDAQLADYTTRVKQLNLMFRAKLADLLPRKNIAPKPVPERIGEPSVFKHVLYIIKENRTYDQVLGDMPQGDGRADLCLFGNAVTPNEHQLAKDFSLLDNYYASGKSSAEGHQWTDAAMVTDYVEKSVRAWFRSYPHVQYDAMVYDKQGFIWNNAADHGKNVRIYGEACVPQFKKGTTWNQIYDDYKAGKPFVFKNTTTISRVRPLLSANYPGFDTHEINDQVRASAFIDELKDYEKQDGDKLPELMVMALPSDHTGGTKYGLPTPRAQVADNDLALGRIVEALSKSRFWKNTVIFVTEDDSQAGWDHVSAYRTTGFVISPYSRLQQTIHTNYNQTCMVRTIEQILGIPPMNSIDATALPMFTCFTNRPVEFSYKAVPNQVPLDEMNPKLSMLKGKALYYAKQSAKPEFNHIDGGNDDLMNRILWQAGKGAKPYPAKLAGKADGDDD
ncbi:MAG: bifunctional YncE family protein/alkaline phosphatase family protein, partial [Mucilaginibacter sp.]